MEAFYRVCFWGRIDDSVFEAISSDLISRLSDCRYELGREVGLERLLGELRDFDEKVPIVVVAFFSGEENLDIDFPESVSILPVVSRLEEVSRVVPERYRHINCLSLEHGIERLTSTIMESLGLLPRQRRVFLSYKRDESRSVALQIYYDLCGRNFEVFLDTHGVSLASDFQETLWERLCESDVLIMLDSPNYFDSRWTSAEYGRALSKGISVLRVSWPGMGGSSKTANAISVYLQDSDLSPAGEISDDKLQEVSRKLEFVRSQSHAVRHINVQGDIVNAVERIGGKYIGVGPHNIIGISLPDGRCITILPVVGVPSARTLHWTRLNCGVGAALLYDSVGLSEGTQSHLMWLGEEIKSVRFVERHRLGWELGDWQ